MATFAHRMPFGAELQPDGGVRFRLWAPGHAKVSLALETEDAVLRMQPLEDGWFELTTGRARPGSLYRFELDDGTRVPDPASRGQAEDVHGPSVVVDPEAYAWRTPDWRGRPWEETVLYELHPGTFSETGDFDGIRAKLDHLADVGITAVELMPVADFPGSRNWGYDGVLPYAPDTAYGPPEALKRLIDEIHERGMTVFLDVVYNHFGPEGNYLHVISPQFFTERHQTPWGAAIDFTLPQVRQFFIQNAVYWLNEYRFDGLRFDAVHAIKDDSVKHFLEELAETVRHAVSQDRHVHLVLENDDNAARFLRRSGSGAAQLFEAQWNDDFHHVAHVLLTGEGGGYYADYVEAPERRLARGLAEGFVYQGDPSPYRDGETRGEPSGDLPPPAFVDFIQNHDQIGNRAFGERLTTLARPEAVRAMVAVTLLAPAIPMLFMGEEWGAEEPFLFFCSFGDELADAVREGRRKEFERFPQFADPDARAAIPDPNSIDTFERSRLQWRKAAEPKGRDWIAFYRHLLEVRRTEIVPRLKAGEARHLGSAFWGRRGLTVEWLLASDLRLTLVANLSDEASAGEAVSGRPLFRTDPAVDYGAAGPRPAWSVAWIASEGATE